MHTSVMERSFSNLFLGFDETEENKRRSDNGEEPVQATITVVCVFVVAFVLGVLIFLVYRNKHRYIKEYQPLVPASDIAYHEFILIPSI